jgi:hypothetical protein
VAPSNIPLDEPTDRERKRQTPVSPG